ncbi:DUF4166 domain-containing protein [Planococcus sp. APC 4015]|nr:DUF4166 domain-containing protein [Planococcus sp. APC 4015]
METPSVYQRVLGERWAELDPRLRPYFGAPPDGLEGVGSGVYDIAGSPMPVLRPLLAWMATRDILFPEFARDVPFTLRNIPRRGGSLGAVRTFRFAGRTRIMRDEMSVVGGGLVDRLGRRGGLEVALDVEVRDGALRLTSRRLALRMRGVRIPLPRFATVTVDERATNAGQHVDVRLRAPVIGEFFRYSGTFSYEYAPATTSS